VARIVSDDGGLIVGGTPEAFGAHIAREVARWSPIIREGGIRTE
jgi:hypothetical protein